MRLALVFVAVLATTATKPGGSGPATLLFAAGAPADLLIRQCYDDNFIMVASDASITGRVGMPGDKGVPAGAIAEALFAGRTHERPLRGKHGSDVVDLDFGGVPPLDLLAIAAEEHHVSFVAALPRDPPKLTIVAHD